MLFSCYTALFCLPQNSELVAIILLSYMYIKLKEEPHFLSEGIKTIQCIMLQYLLHVQPQIRSGCSSISITNLVQIGDRLFTCILNAQQKIVMSLLENYGYYFSVLIFIMLCKMILTFQSVIEILKCDHSNESY